MRLLILGLGLGAASALSACYPDPLDESGKRCNAEFGCGAGFVCQRAMCVREEDLGQQGGAVGVNLITNPRFEMGDPPVGWQVTPPLAALRAAEDVESADSRVAVVESLGVDNERVALEPTMRPVTLTEVGATYCLEVRARAQVAVQVAMVEGALGDALTLGEGIHPTSGWATARASRTVEVAMPLTIRLFADGPGAQEAFAVDRVSLWRSPGAACDTAPDADR